MSFVKPFAPTGKTITLTTNGSASTTNSLQILPSDFGYTGSIFPPNYMFTNNGTADIWIVMATTAAVAAAAAFPTAGTTTVGTPQLGFRLKPGVIQVMSFDGQVLFVGDLSTGTSQSFDITPGEGS
jgi:hypothetical protein